MSPEPKRRLGIAFEAAIGIVPADTSAHSGWQAAVAQEHGLRSYPVHVSNEFSEEAKALLVSTRGVVWGSGRTIECVADICERLTGWNGSIGRLSNGEYVALWLNEDKSWSLRTSSDIRTISRNSLNDWPGSDASPRWLPKIPNYTLDFSSSIPVGPSLFLGIWSKRRGMGPRHIIAVFSGDSSKTLKMSGDRSYSCIFATSQTPIIAASATHPFQGMGLPFTFVLRPKGANYIHVLNYGLFTDRVECMPPP